MSLVAACDPGIRASGLSIWDDGVLQWAGLVVSPETTARGPLAWAAMARAITEAYPLALDVLVVELQQVYPGGLGPPPDDLMQLTGMVGCLVGLYEGRCGRVEGYYPRQWSQVKKEVRHERLYLPGVLSLEEWTRCEGGPQKDRDDAICLGLWWAARSGERTTKEAA